MNRTKKFVLELLAAAAIVGTIGAVALPAVASASERSTDTEMQEQSVDRMYISGRKYFQ